MAYSGILCESQAGKEIQNTARVTGDTVSPQEPTAKISIQSLEQNKIKKVDAADSNVKMKKCCVPNFRQRW
ncbi:hypothetical protein [Bacillus cereus]|uniref:hypothetical protein n=1 Tax=Bacillus cereus TaxID=1396 RepID=UPI0018F2AF61|nr:hypothetical protein [Bacillus cereus]MBJ7987531.1 hypothetical protein [Bacillus cereus]